MNKKRFIKLYPLFCLTLLLGACGGGSNPAASNSANINGTPTGLSTPLPALQVAELLFAQTHVLPAKGLSWTLTDIKGKTKTTQFKLIGKRDTLAIISLAQNNVQNPSLDIWQSGIQVANIPLHLPSALPATESAGAAFRSNSYTATIPAQWMQQGVQLKVSANNYQTSTFLDPLDINNAGELTLKILPFYVYGASSGVGGAPTLAQTQLPDAITQQELFAKWPLAKLDVQTHGAGFIQWPYMIISPRGGNPAYRALSKNDQKDGFATMGAVLNVFSALRSANGDSATNNIYYAPLIMWDNTGTYQGPGGGLGGGHRGTGNFNYTGIFIHEVGHAFGLPHQGTAYLDGKYPYIDGSLKGSTWGFDQIKQEFLAPFLPSSSARFSNCLTNPVGRPTDTQGRCVKRDPMWAGNKDQAVGYKYATFSDFSTAQMQQDINATIHIDPYSATGYSKWDAAKKQRLPITPTTQKGGLGGLDNGLPTATNVDVYSIVMTYSNAPCNAATNPTSVCNAAGVDTNISQIYPTTVHKGNLRRLIDPTNPAELATIVPNSSTNYWYCKNGGCDYTIKVTYADTTTWYAVIQGGFRPWFKDTLPPSAAAQDPYSSSSFKTWGINAPATQPIAKIELLSTPQVWNGFPVAPTVLMVR